ncbi:MAG: hypothetical protein GX675_07650 [Erysipelotrichaceae bacterium]|nr:hypothetical protein [Erysipelotrichaceae bacterium]
MKKYIIFILLFSITFISSCNNTNINKIENTNSPKNISGQVIELNKDYISIQTSNKTINFNISNIDIKDILVDDYVSIIYNGQINKDEAFDVEVISIVLEKRETVLPVIKEITTIVEDNSDHNYILINEEDNILKILNDNIVIEFEGNLVKGMKIHITYLETKNEEYDGILQSIEILEN